MFKKAFTLIEITIVTIIVAVLFTILAKAYMISSKLYIYEMNHKNLEKDILFINQNIQNLADSTEINFDKYENLSDNLWFTGILHLKDDNYKYKLYQSWQKLFLDKWTGNKFEKIKLTTTWSNIIKKLKFKIIPYQDPFKYFKDNNKQPYVTIFLDMQTKFFNPKRWEHDIKYQLQEGFNFRYYNQ